MDRTEETSLAENSMREYLKLWNYLRSQRKIYTERKCQHQLSIEVRAREGNEGVGGNYLNRYPRSHVKKLF
jgi:hypothetical protein